MAGFRAGFGASTLGVGRGFRRWVWSASRQLPTTTIRVTTHRNTYPGVDDAAASCAADLHEVDRRPRPADRHDRDGAMPDDCGFAVQQDAGNPGRGAHQLTEQP